MASGALSPAVVDVPLGTLSALPPDHAGPAGRLTQVYDAVIRHYAEAGGKRVFLEPRAGFSTFSDVLRNSASGVVESGTWASPSFLYALGDQLLSICTDRPRVFTGTDWTNYGNARIVTQRLSESVLHASNATIAAPDSAWITGVTCSCWTEQNYTQFFNAEASRTEFILKTSFWIGFRADDGAWVRVPEKLFEASAADAQYMLGKVVQDGENFWIFYNTQGFTDEPLISVEVHDTNGVRLAVRNFDRNWETSPGYWDAYGSPLAGVILAQPAGFTPTYADVDVELSKLALMTGTIVDTTVSVDATCTGPLAWLTNDLTGTSVYLATIGDNTGAIGPFFAYEIDEDLAIAHTYAFGVTPALLPDNMTGWVEETGTPGERNVYISYSQLAGPAATIGPTFDPATRFIKTIKRTFAGATSTIRTTHSVIQQSRAFAINGEYYAYTYYQSGSGQALPSGIQDYEGTDDVDYFIGAAVQPLHFTSGGTYGAPSPPSSPGFLPIWASMAPANISAAGTPDKVESVLTPVSGVIGLPDGTPILKWTFQNATFPTNNGGAVLHLSAGASIGASTTWDILAYSGATIVYTSSVSRQGAVITPGTFSTSGTVEVEGTMFYAIADLETFIPPGVEDLYVNGTITVSGASNGGNNGTFTIARISRSPNPFSTGNVVGVWAIVTTQVNENPSAASVVVSTNLPYNWFFAGSGETFSDADIGTRLSVTDNAVTNNNGSFSVEDDPSSTSLQTNAAESAGLTTQIFDPAHLPSAQLELTDPSTAYTLHVQLIDFDYTFIGALISLDTGNPRVDGVYKVIEIIDAHTARVLPTDGQTGQRSLSLDSGDTILVQLTTNVQAQTQPEWFVTPLTGSQPQVGMFEKGLAYADWRFDGETSAAPDFDGQDRYRFALSSTSNLFDTTRQVVLPFRANTFTQVSIATVGATEINIANTALASTVGLKIFRSEGHGEGTGDAGKLLVPGLLATEFSQSGFAESNFNVGPEAPFVVSQDQDTDTNFALTPGKAYTYQAVFATTLENGDVVRSLPSPPIQVTLIGDNNFAVIGGRLPKPLNSDGAPTSNVYGLTNNRQVTIEIYRSVIVDGVPSTQLHIITDPSNPNGLYAGSGTGSGFTFPDTFTWNYRDENPDAGIRATQVVYAGALGQGIAPHFPAPAFRHATTWNNRRWVVGYDGAVWMSSEMIEGEPPWFFPGFRYPFPGEDPAVCVVGFENFLFILCAKSVWRVPLAELPNATLTSGAMPAPVKLPFAMGCSGFAVACSDFVAFSSSVADGRQVWAITRNLSNEYLSEPLGEFNQPVSAMAVDGSQRLMVAAADSVIRLFDPVSREWWLWRTTTTPTLLANYLGQPTYEDGAFVSTLTDSGIVDVYDDTETPVALDATLSSLSFAAVRAVKRLWEAQIIGRWNSGPVNINAVISYPDDATADPTTFGPQEVTEDPLLLAINPAIEDATSFTVRIFGSYEDIEEPGRCFSLEMLSCEVGLDSSQGLRKLPNGFRLVGT